LFGFNERRIDRWKHKQAAWGCCVDLRLFSVSLSALGFEIKSSATQEQDMRECLTPLYLVYAREEAV